MKKFYLIAAAAAAVLAAGCAKNEVIQNQGPGDAVTFGVYVPKTVETKATPGTQTNATLATDGFGILAFYTDNSSYNSSTSTPNFMYNTQVSNSGAGWTYSPIKYWPNEHGTNAASGAVDKLSFFAYAPWVSVTNLANGSTGLSEGITSLTGNNAGGDPKVTFTIPTKAANQIDLLWGVAAAGAPTATAQVDPANTITTGMPFIDLTKQECDGNVKFLFKHALAKLDFKVQAIVDNDTEETIAVDGNTKVFVRKVEVFGKFHTSSTLNLNNTTVGAGIPNWVAPTTTNAGTDPVFIFNDGKQDANDKLTDGSESADIADAFVDGAGVTKVAQKLLKNDHEFLIIPTDLTGAGKGFKVRITYDIETTDPNLAGYLTDGTTNGSKVKNVITTKDAVSLNFEAGKIYTITLKLGLTSVKMVAEVADWINAASNPDVYLPQNVD